MKAKVVLVSGEERTYEFAERPGEFPAVVSNRFKAEVVDHISGVREVAVKHSGRRAWDYYHVGPITGGRRAWYINPTSVRREASMLAPGYFEGSW